MGDNERRIRRGVKEHSASEVVRNGLIAHVRYAFVAIAPVIVASSEVHGAAIAFGDHGLTSFSSVWSVFSEGKMTRRCLLNSGSCIFGQY